jgi:general secretion pathway protein F
MRFQIRVLQEGDNVAALTLDARDAAEAASMAKAQGHEVLSVKSQFAWPVFSGLGGRFGSGFQISLFSRELLTLLRAGLNLVESLETLAEKEHRSEQRKMLHGVIARLYEGHPLSHALQQYPAFFPPLYVATVRASEKTGDIGEALERYVTYQTQADAVRKRIVSAAIYPALLMVAGTAVTLFLLFYVVPKFSRIYEDVGRDMPFFSQLLMSWGMLLEGNKLLVITVLLGLIGGAAYLLFLPAFRRRLLEQVWRVPTLGERLKIYQLARFYHTMGMLLRGGIPAVTALDMVSGLLPHAQQAALERASKAIREGLSISVAMEGHGLATPVSVRLLRVGERTGNMGEMMEQIAGFYDDELARWVDWFTRLFEPLLMAFIGGVIGLIVVLMYLPIFELAGSIQ